MRKSDILMTMQPCSLCIDSEMKKEAPSFPCVNSLLVGDCLERDIEKLTASLLGP